MVVLSHSAAEEGKPRNMRTLLTHKSIENSISPVKRIQDQVSAERGVVEGMLPPHAYALPHVAGSQ